MIDCRHLKEDTKDIHRICKITKGICMCDEDLCSRILSLENAIFEIDRLLSSATSTKDQIRSFIKAVKRDTIND
jgi:hypothetical protein